MQKACKNLDYRATIDGTKNILQQVLSNEERALLESLRKKKRRNDKSWTPTFDSINLNDTSSLLKQSQEQRKNNLATINALQRERKNTKLAELAELAKLAELEAKNKLLKAEQKAKEEDLSILDMVGGVMNGAVGAVGTVIGAVIDNFAGAAVDAVNTTGSVVNDVSQLITGVPEAPPLTPIASGRPEPILPALSQLSLSSVPVPKAPALTNLLPTRSFIDRKVPITKADSKISEIDREIEHLEREKKKEIVKEIAKEEAIAAVADYDASAIPAAPPLDYYPPIIDAPKIPPHVYLVSKEPTRGKPAPIIGVYNSATGEVDRSSGNVKLSVSSQLPFSPINLQEQKKKLKQVKTTISDAELKKVVNEDKKEDKCYLQNLVWDPKTKSCVGELKYEDIEKIRKECENNKKLYDPERQTCVDNNYLNQIRLNAIKLRPQRTSRCSNNEFEKGGRCLAIAGNGTNAPAKTLVAHLQQIREKLANDNDNSEGISDDDWID